jgi:hypothetical protein
MEMENMPKRISLSLACLLAANLDELYGISISRSFLEFPMNE